MARDLRRGRRRSSRLRSLRPRHLSLRKGGCGRRRGGEGPRLANGAEGLFRRAISEHRGAGRGFRIRRRGESGASTVAQSACVGQGKSECPNLCFVTQDEEQEQSVVRRKKFTYAWVREEKGKENMGEKLTKVWV